MAASSGFQKHSYADYLADDVDLRRILKHQRRTVGGRMRLDQQPVLR
jgi:hypothetical protein